MQKGDAIMLQTILTVKGMACSMCEAHVNDVIRRNFPVKKVSASHKKESVEILSEQSLDGEKLKSALKEIGYDVTDINEKQYEKKGLFHR